eukprot:g7416.t1
MCCASCAADKVIGGRDIHVYIPASLTTLDVKPAGPHSEVSRGSLRDGVQFVKCHWESFKPERLRARQGNRKTTSPDRPEETLSGPSFETLSQQRRRRDTQQISQQVRTLGADPHVAAAARCGDGVDLPLLPQEAWI